jgi:hypothetical protein
VTLTIKTKKDKKPWHFVFSRYRNIKEDDWTVVKADQSVSLEAVGKPSFSMETKKGDTVKPGEQINISPRFYTEHGLLISLSARGDQMGSFDFDRTHNRCTLELQSPKGKTLSTANSGFA